MRLSQTSLRPAFDELPSSSLAGTVRGWLLAGSWRDRGPEPPEDAPSIPLRQCTHCRESKHEDQFLHRRKPRALVRKCLDRLQCQKAQSTGQRVCSSVPFVTAISNRISNHSSCEVVLQFKKSSHYQSANCLSSHSAMGSFLGPIACSPIAPRPADQPHLTCRRFPMTLCF
ncbi:hypothetical protein HDV57DRAFT_97161 [Trichoderma longibrachiatum]|uniref:Uncharacterized protein n=1 Tax=Trichoderma longibrachiatum ATCC 18648 TaxID=983965 RepID=A0A2T4BSX3_TRILO|nr:hypothetical protein M440DRAFT_156176 [Trichoderma longibrachiatum ATCC 18648]